MIYRGAIERWWTTDAATDDARLEARRRRLSVLVLAIDLLLMLAPASVAALVLAGVLT